MVRTKADTARKAGGKAPRKNPVSSRNSSSGASKNAGKKSKHGSGNPYCCRPIPAWQIPINKIFQKSNGESAAVSASDMDAPLESDDLVSPSSRYNFDGTEPSTSQEPGNCDAMPNSSEADAVPSNSKEDVGSSSSEMNAVPSSSEEDEY